jgi:hypothetical protein
MKWGIEKTFPLKFVVPNEVLTETFSSGISFIVGGIGADLSSVEFLFNDRNC